MRTCLRFHSGSKGDGRGGNEGPLAITVPQIARCAKHSGLTGGWTGQVGQEIDRALSAVVGDEIVNVSSMLIVMVKD